MYCHIVKKYLLAPYMDGELSPLRRGMVEKHLRRCAACTESLARTRAAEAYLGRWKADDAPERLLDAIRSDIRKYEAEIAPQWSETVLRPVRRQATLVGHIFNRRFAYATVRLAVVLILATALIYHALPDASVARALAVSGQVYIARPGQDVWREIAKDTKIFEGDRIKFAGPADYLDLTVTKTDQTVRIKKSAVSEAGRTIKVRLDQGKIRARPMQRDRVTKFQVTTPAKVVELQGDTAIIGTFDNGDGNIVVVDPSAT